LNFSPVFSSCASFSNQFSFPLGVPKVKVPLDINENVNTDFVVTIVGEHWGENNIASILGLQPNLLQSFSRHFEPLRLRYILSDERSRKYGNGA